MSHKFSFDPDIFKDVLSAMSEARLEEGAKRKGRRWSLDTITPRFNLWKRSGSVIDGGLLSHRNSIATPVTIAEEGKTPSPGRRMKKTLPHGDVYAVLDLADGRHVVLSGRDETHLKTLYVDAAMEYKVSSYRVIVASTKSILKLDNGSPTVTKSFENMFEKYESVDPSAQKSEDPRFRLAEELLQTERDYCSNLQCIFDCYAEPLRKYSSLSKEDHRMLFMAVEPILSISAMLASKLESVIQTWNTHTTKLGNLFPSKFWNQYAEYYDNYLNTKSFLEEKCATDSTFAEFCNLRKEQGKLGIDTLLFLPIKRIPEYDKYLNDLLDETDSSHTDFDDLKKAVDKVTNMVREREDELREADNDNKVEAVQDRFPHDDLQLRDRDKAQKLRSAPTRRKSAPSAVLFKSLGSGKSKSSSSLWSHNMVKKEGDVSTRPGSEGNRLYVMEGSAQLAAGMQTQDRYLFLFSDLLLIAKQKSNTTFKLKHRIQLCDVWIANCIEEVSELTRPQDRSFVIGWPTTNTVATFKDAETKEKWLTKLTAQIQEEKLKEESRTTQLKVVNRHIDQKCTVTVNNTCEARDVLRMCMAQLLIQESEQKDYQLWVLTGRETIYPLIGHEYPYAIKLSHVRDLLKPKGDVDSEVLSNMDSIMEESSNSKVEFILKHKKSPKKHSLEDTSQKSLKKAKKSPLLALFKKNKDEKSQVPGNSKPGKLFERPLEEVCDEHSQPPKAIMELLTILFREGPLTGGILRKSANARQIRELRQKLDSEDEVSLDQYSRYLIGSLVKEYFRTLPSCLLGENLYEQWVKTVEIEDEHEHLSRVIDLYHEMPLCNQLLLKFLMSVLYQIDHHQDVNMMTANNISVCIAPSLLWQKHDDMANYSVNVSSVVAVVEFMIKNACSVFGDDTPHLLGEVDHKMRQDSGTDSDSLNNGLRRDDSSIDSLVDRDLYTETDASPKLAKSHLSPSNLSHDSGLSHSDSQLNDEECDFDTTERKMYRSTSYMDHDNDIYTRSIDNLDNQNPVPPPRYRRKKEYMQSSSFDNYNRQYVTSYPSGARLCHSLEPEVLRQMQLQKRISCDSLHSVEETTEAECEKDFSSHRKSAEIYLIKSASGAHLYMDSETLPRVSSVEGQTGRQGRDRLVRQSSVTDSTPPLSPHSKHSYGSSYDSVLSDSSYMHDLSRGTSINSAPQTPDVDSDRLLWSLEERERSNSNPTTLHSNVNSTESTSPTSLSATYGGYTLKSMQNMRYLVSPPASPAVERRVKTSESVKDPSVRHSLPAATYKTTVQKEVPAVTSPQISITYCSSGSDERLDDNDSSDKVRRASFESGSSSGAPVKQISMYSQGLSSQSRLQGQRMSPRKDSTPVKASHDSVIVSQIRRNSLESASKSDDDCESRTSSLPESLSKSKLLRNYGRNYDSESKTSSEHLDFESKRPHQPPSYQEAVNRNYRIKHGIPLIEISEQDTQRQKEASARAAKLYADSLKKYYGASDDSEKSGNVMKQTSHLKQHIEQTTDPVTKTYRTVREESSKVVQVFSPDEDEEKEDIYVTLRKHPRDVYNQSMKLYEQQSKVTQKNEVKSDNGPSSCSSSNSSAFSQTNLPSRASYDPESSRSYKPDSKVHSKSEGVRTNNESGSYSKVESNESIKTTLTLPGVHRSLSDSADRLNKLSRYSPRVSRRDYDINKENEEKRDTSPIHNVQRTTYFYEPREEKTASSSSTQNQYSSKVSTQNVSTSSSVLNVDKSKSKTHSLVTVTVTNPTESSSSSASRDLPWSVSQLKQKFAGKSDDTTTTTSSHFYAPEQKTSRSVSSVTITSTSRPGPPPYKSPPPFRRLADNSRLSTSSNSSNGSASNHSSSTKTHKSVSTHKFGPQSLDYGSYSSSSEDLDTPSLYPFRRKESGSGVSDQEIDCYTDISYV
ncbi:serine-rich adhesin for platelets-like isoform X1 [Haliotis asinina]|uniref:serine-rich adhesin for platelets-like isoform X1 n=3 Tax=Haliotis asinina TaxID=109174 RepID=UPI00353251FE